MNLIVEIIFRVSSFIRRHILLIIPIVLGVIYLFCNLDWWFFGSFSKFQQWYNTYGFLIWIVKQLGVFLFILLLSFVFIIILQIIWRTIRFAFKLLLIHSSSPFLIFCLYIMLSLQIGEQHPFSLFSMYNKLTSTKRYFYLTNEDDELIPNMKSFKVPSSFINKYYDTFSMINDTCLDEEGNCPNFYNDFGEFVLEKVKPNVENNMVPSFNFYLVKEDLIGRDTILLNKTVDGE